VPACVRAAIATIAQAPATTLTACNPPGEHMRVSHSATEFVIKTDKHRILPAAFGIFKSRDTISRYDILLRSSVTVG
jgi:hypothetical protein